MKKLELAKEAGRRLRADSLHIDYQPEHKEGPRLGRGLNSRGVYIKQYQGNPDVAYVDRWGPDADIAEIKSWAMGYGWDVDTDADGRLIISR